MGSAERGRGGPARALVAGLLLGLAVGAALAQVDPSPSRIAPQADAHRDGVLIGQEYAAPAP